MKTLIASSVLVSSMILTGCVTFPTQESEKVDVIWDEVEVVKDCKRMGIVFGSEGHFYDYWLHADKNMVWGTLNQMRIKTAALGADTLYLYQSLNFSSSVTMFGNAYLCDKKEEAKPSVK